MTVLSILLSSVPGLRFGQVVESIRAVCCTAPRRSHLYCILCDYCYLESDTAVALACMMLFVKTPLNIDYFPFFNLVLDLLHTYFPGLFSS